MKNSNNQSEYQITISKVGRLSIHDNTLTLT